MSTGEVSVTGPPDVPVPAGRPYQLAFVCLGNICRSPMADVVLSELVDRAGLGSRVEVSSCGTGDWHLGQPMDERAAAQLSASSYDPDDHRAQQLDASWFDRDLLLAMDHSNLRTVQDLARQAEVGLRPGQLRLFREYDPLAGPDEEVPDPWTGGPDGFVSTLEIVERTCRALLTALGRRA